MSGLIATLVFKPWPNRPVLTLAPSIWRPMLPPPPAVMPAKVVPAPPLPLPEPKVVPMQVTGPPSQRLNMILLGDGYQWDQQSIFMADVDRNLSVMWATEPFRTYRNYINVYAVEIASIDYGVRCDPDGRVRAAHSASSVIA